MIVSKLKSKTLQWHKTGGVCAMKDPRDLKMLFKGPWAGSSAYPGQESSYPCLSKSR